MGERVIEGRTFTVIIDQDESEEFKDVTVNPRYMLTEHVVGIVNLASSLYMNRVPVDEENALGYQRYRQRTPQEALNEAFTLYEGTMHELIERKYAIELPTRDELRKDKTPTGFTK